MKNLIDFFGPYQVVSSETRITVNSSSLRDYVIANDKLLRHQVVNYPFVADHCGILVEISYFGLKLQQKNIEKKLQEFRPIMITAVII